MRIALCNEVIREMQLAEQAAFAAALGYDGLELAPFTLDADQPHRLGDARLASIRRDVEAAGIVVSGLHWLLVAPVGLSITTADAGVRAATLEVMKGLVDQCAALGGSYLIHGSPAQRELEAGTEADGRKRAAEYFAAAAERAGNAGVTYCLEPLSPTMTNFVTCLEEAAPIVEDIGSPAFTAMLDTSAAAAGERATIPDLLNRHLADGLITHVHFNDPNRQGPGQGDMNFAPAMATLLEAGYDRWIGIEPFVYEPDGPASAARAIGYVRGLVDAV